MKEECLISIIVPCYNQAQYLDECLQSVLDQTYKNWECIIVNDGSPDNTEEIAQRWLNKDSRFKYLYQDNSGVVIARNNGIESAKGEWILPLDGDDKIGDRYLELASKYFNTSAKIIYGAAELFGNQKGPFIARQYSYDAILSNNIIYVSAFFRKRDWENSKKYDPFFKKGLEDWDFWISLLEKNDIVIYINEIVFYYRIKGISRNTEIHENNNLMTEYQNYIFNKHKKKYLDEFGNYFETLEKLQKLKSINLHYEKIINSKRFKFINKIFIYFDKIKNLIK